MVEEVPISLVSGQENLAPRLFVAGDSVFLSRLEIKDSGETALWFSRWDGSAWVEPWCASSGQHWIANPFDIPNVLVHGWEFSAFWLERVGEGRQGYGVKVIQISRQGEDDSLLLSTWLHSDTSDCEHGFASLVPTDSHVLGLWLDGRETISGGATSLRAARITPAGIAHEAVLDPRVCDCCPTAAIRAPDGSIVVAYRDRSEDEIRDIAVTRWVDGTWSAPRTVQRDEWKIAGCPVNGPALAVNDSLLALAWFGLAGGVDPTVQVAFSRNSGGSFGKPVRVDLHHAEGRADVTFLEDGRALVVWIEATDSAATLWARAVDASGQRDTALLVTSTAPGGLSGIPTVEARGEDVMLAWTEEAEGSRVKTARLRF